MEVLLDCEESQEVCKEFRAKGHHAFSCDILPCSGGHPEWHIQGDAITVAKSRQWDRIISFPPCTDLAVSGSQWFDKKRLSGEQECSIYFFLHLWELSNCVENPKNIMSGWRYLKKWFPKVVEWMIEHNFPTARTQVIHPWEYGHKSSKETWLWLKGLPPLKSTKIVGPPKPYKEMTKVELKEWTEVHRCSPGPQRPIIRSKTYPGIAKAMADQWG